jgi:diguanylate cyclase (GGDEF)-like protein
MKLRFLIAAGTAVVTLTLVVAVLVLGHQVLDHSYAVLEARHLQDDLKQTLDLLQVEAENLDVVTHDYGSWDDTWKFMAVRSRTYLKNNYGQLSLKNLNVQLVMILDPQQKVVFSRTLGDADSSRDERTLLGLSRELSTRIAGEHSVCGFLMLSRGPVAVALRPILDSDGKGPSHGTLIMVRDLDYRFIAHLSALAQVPLTLQPLDRVTDPQWQAARRALASGQPNFMHFTEDRGTLFGRVSDLLGRPAMLLRIEHDREIWNRGLVVRRLLMWLAIAISVLFGILYLGFIQHCIVRRLERLIAFASSISTDKGLHRRIELGGNDEITELGSTLNRMLDDLQLSQQQLVSAGERLQYEATHDALTGAWNRAAGIDLLDRELDRCSRDCTQVAVILLDLDQFKNVNDLYGHAAGDAVLKHFTANVSRNLRSFDVLVRYGGEEFLIIAPNCGMAEARVLTERLLQSLRSVAISVGNNFIHLTASAGVTAGAAPFTSEELISVADVAMYRAKANGRDCAHLEEVKTNRTVRGQLFALPSLPADASSQTGH